jgi:hypothetical protein
VNGIGPYILPNTSMLTVVLAPGLYDATSCGTYGLRPLNISGAGSGATVVDCARTGRFLLAFSTTIVSGLTVQRGAVTVAGVGSNGVAVDGGGAIAVLWSTQTTPAGLFHAGMNIDGMSCRTHPPCHPCTELTCPT